jgi:hypothetical protein
LLQKYDRAWFVQNELTDLSVFVDTVLIALWADIERLIFIVIMNIMLP